MLLGKIIRQIFEILIQKYINIIYIWIKIQVCMGGGDGARGGNTKLTIRHPNQNSKK